MGTTYRSLVDTTLRARLHARTRRDTTAATSSTPADVDSGGQQPLEVRLLCHIESAAGSSKSGEHWQRRKTDPYSHSYTSVITRPARPGSNRRSSVVVRLVSPSWGEPSDLSRSTRSVSNRRKSANRWSAGSARCVISASPPCFLPSVS